MVAMALESEVEVRIPPQELEHRGKPRYLIVAEVGPTVIKEHGAQRQGRLTRIRLVAA